MSVLQAVGYALFCMFVVFMVLIALWGVIRLFSYIIGLIEGRKQKKQ